MIISFQILCTGFYYDQWIYEDQKPGFDKVIALPSLAIHVIFSGIVARSKMSKKNLRSNTKETHFGEYKTQWLFAALGIFFLFFGTGLKRSEPLELNHFPRNILSLMVHLFIPAVAILSVAFLLINESKELQKLCKKNFHIPENSVKAEVQGVPERSIRTKLAISQ